MGTRVNLAAFDTMINNFRTLRDVQMFVAPIVIEPQTKKQHKTSPEVEQKENINIQTDHTRIPLKRLPVA